MITRRLFLTSLLGAGLAAKVLGAEPVRSASTAIQGIPYYTSNSPDASRWEPSEVSVGLSPNGHNVRFTHINGDYRDFPLDSNPPPRE